MTESKPRERVTIEAARRNVAHALRMRSGNQLERERPKLEALLKGLCAKALEGNDFETLLRLTQELIQLTADADRLSTELQAEAQAGGKRAEPRQLVDEKSPKLSAEERALRMEQLGIPVPQVESRDQGSEAELGALKTEIEGVIGSGYPLDQLSLDGLRLLGKELQKPRLTWRDLVDSAHSWLRMTRDPDDRDFLTRFLKNAEALEYAPTEPTIRQLLRV